MSEEMNITKEEVAKHSSFEDINTFMSKVKEIEKIYKDIYTQKVAIEYLKSQILICQKGVKLREKCIELQEMALLCLKGNGEDAQKIYDDYQNKEHREQE